MLPAVASPLVLVLALWGLVLPAGAEDVKEGFLEDELSLLQQSHRVRAPNAQAAGGGATSDLEIPPAIRQGRRILAKPMSHRNATVPTIVVDLDVAPELRWRNVTRHYRDLGIFPDCCSFGPVEIALLKPLLASIPLADEYRRELEGIVADIGHPGVTVESLFTINLGYEFSGRVDGPLKIMEVAAKLASQNVMQATSQAGGPLGVLDKIASAMAVGSVPRKSHGCSAVLAAMPDGTVVHGRNMDYADWELTINGTNLHWPEVTIDVLFTKAGKPFIVSAHWPGQTGLHTAMRFGGWSFQQNTRFHSLTTDVLYALLRHSDGFQFRSRRIMETTPDFETAVQKMYNTDMMAPQYFIMAGAKPYQGAVLSMDRGGRHLPGTPPLMRLGNASAGKRLGTSWYLVQTNDDMFEQPRDHRRPDQELRLSTATQSMVSTEWMWKEMLGLALYMEDTVFTSVYVPATGYHETLAHPGQFR